MTSQRAIPLDTVQFESGTDWDEADDREDGVDWRPFIGVDPDIVFGKPRVTGTRLAVEFLLELFAGGWTEAEVLDSYPSLTRADLRAVFAYAASLAKERQERPSWMMDDRDAPGEQTRTNGPRALPR